MPSIQHDIKPHLMLRGNESKQAAMDLNFAVITTAKLKYLHNFSSVAE